MQPRRFAERLRMRLALLFKLLWPRFTKAYEYVLLGYNVAYLFDKTPYYRPWPPHERSGLREPDELPRPLQSTDPPILLDSAKPKLRKQPCAHSLSLRTRVQACSQQRCKRSCEFSKWHPSSSSLG